MRLHRLTAADRTWREKADDNASVFGAIIVLIVIGIPLILL